mmetsp:Transcript_8751/g.14894  ORF Transcript_8751/g.14894 Transcript_8751/m.14894 type:complete len:240 (+) Transcript_8751:84-803(+)
MSHNYGTGRDLPADIADVLDENARKSVVYWSRPVPGQDFFRDAYCFMLGPAVFIPCFWPIFMLLSPCQLTQAHIMRNETLATAIVVSEKSLDYITLPYEKCLCPGVSTQSLIKNTVLAERIVSVEIDLKDSGLLVKCQPDLTRLRVDTNAGYATPHVRIFVGHENLEELKSQILRLKGDVSAAATTTSNFQSSAETMTPLHTNHKATSDRIMELKNLLDSGLISSIEYEQKKSEILSYL